MRRGNSAHANLLSNEGRIVASGIKEPKPMVDSSEYSPPNPKKRIRTSYLLLLSLLIFLTIGLAGIFFFRPAIVVQVLVFLSPEVVYSFDTNQKLVALTIDDGPDPTWTPKILDLLQQHGARATFFLIGSRIPGNEDILEQMVLEGHEIGNHMAREEPSIALNPEEFEQKLLETDQMLAQYSPQNWFRPGSGWYSHRMLTATQEYGYTTVMGSVFPFDTYYHAPKFASWYILTHIHPGAIIVLHDHGERTQQTVDVLMTVIPELQKLGYQFVTLSELDERAR